MRKRLIPFLLAILLLPMASNAQNHYIIPIGEGSATSPNAPAYAYYNYSISQMLYTANQIGIDGNIDTIAFNVDENSTSRTWTIYMAEVNQTDLTSPVPGSSFRQVFHGNVSLTPGWVNIALDSSFSYQDTGSLAICVIDGTGSYTSNYTYFVGSEYPNYQCCYAQSDYSQYSLSDMPSLSNTYFLPNIRLSINSYSIYCAPPLQVTASNISSSQATISWIENGSAAEWELLISDSAIANPNTAAAYTVTASTPSYTATGLTPNTLYYVYVRSSCEASSTSSWVSTTFRTHCSGYTDVPYSQSFEGLNTGDIPLCWLSIAQGSSGAGTFPSAYNYSTNAHNSNVYYEFESTTGETEIAALPEMDAINTLQLSFYAAVMNNNLTLEVGVMEDTLFVPVDTIALTPGSNNQWARAYQPYTVLFDNYEGTGTRIALRVTAASNYTLMLDDILVSLASSCAAPTQFTATSPLSTSATLKWHDPQGFQWDILFDTANFNPDSNDLVPVSVYDTTATLSDLVSGTTYYAYLRSACGGESSNWVGPVTFTPGSYVMGYSGSDTIYACNTTVFDNGGPDNPYSAYDNFTLVIYPSSEDSLISLSGTTDIYNYYARLRIFDGVGTEGTVLWASSANNQTFSNIRSTVGPVTIMFNAGTYAGSYAGFQININCISAPQCPFVDGITPTRVAPSSVHLSWQVSGSNLGTPSQYEIECHDNTGALATQTTSTSTSSIVTGLLPSTTYLAKVRILCDNNEYGNWDSTTFTTAPLPCLTFDTTTSDSLFITGSTPQTTNYLPTYNYSNYSYTQQLILSEELQTNAIIEGIGFNFAGSNPDSTKSNCTIYLAQTTVSSIASAYVPFDSTSFQMVYQGPFYFQPGWNRLDFIAPFHYDGSHNLIVAVVDNSASYNYNNYFHSHSIVGRSRYISSYSNPVNITTATGSPASYRNDMRFYVAGCSQNSSCASPTPVVDSATSTDIYLSWMPGFQETSWELAYRPADTSLWTTVGIVNNNSYHFSDLTPDTRYHFRVTSLCSDTNMTNEIAYSTLCNTTPLPFTYGFEDFPSSTETTMPSCWYKNTSNPYNTYYPYSTTSYSHSGNNSLYLYSTSSDHTYAVLPVFDAVTNQLELTLWAFNNSTYSTPSFSVGVMTDPANFSTFTSLSTLEPSVPNEWQAYRISFSNYMGTAKHIAIAMTDNMSGSVYIDDIEVNIIRSCSPATHVTANAVGPYSADIVWDSTDATEYVVEYGPTGFSHGSGNTVSVFNDHHVTLTGLTPNTAYDVYVATICYGDTANWSLLYTFRTNCLTIDTLPYTTSFEDIPSSWASDMSSNFYPCWTRANSTASYQSVYIADAYPHNGSYGINWYCNSYDQSFPLIALPEIDTASINLDTLQLSFWAKRSSYTYNDDPTIAIGIISNPSSVATFQAIDTITISNSDDWNLYVIPLTGHTYSGNHIALQSIPTSGNWTAYLDDFTIEPAASCPFVGNLNATASSSTSALLTWSERGTASQYEVAFDTSATATPTSSLTVYDTTANVTGLTTLTRYYFWVRAVCSENEYSEWVGPVLAIPGSHYMVPNQTDTLYMCGGLIFDNGGPTQSYSQSQDSYIILMPDSADLLVSVSGMSQTEGSYHYFTIYDGIGTAGRELYSDYDSHDTNYFSSITSSNGPLTLYLHSDSYYSPEYFGFEVHVNCISTYCRITDVALDNSVAPSANALALTWHGNGASSYQIEYGPRGFAQGTGTLLSTTSNSTIITGLNSATYYDVYIRSLCGEGDTGVWNNATFMTALCDNASIAYSYDSTMLPTTTESAPIGYSYYNYSYTQTIIDSAHLASLSGPITAFTFSPTSPDGGNQYNNITLYMANIAESNLNDGFLLPDSNHTFVKVLDSVNLSYTSSNIQIVNLDTSFTWDGHSNILLAAKRDNGSYTSGSQFAAHTTTSGVTRYSDSDNSPYDINNPSATTSYHYGVSNLVPDIQLISCFFDPCPAPSITSLTHDYESATITWNGTGSNYQVNIKEASATSWPTPDITVAGNSYTFTALQPSTSYTVRVRQDCSADSLGYSDWTIDGLVTDSLNCLFPTDLAITDITNNAATFDWTPAGIETMWEIHIWHTSGLDSIYTLSSHPATLGGFVAGLTYNVSIRSLCGSAHNIVGDWSPTTTFATATCPNVTGLSVDNVTANSVTLTWTPDPMALSWIIEYGYIGFDQGSGITATSTTPTITISSLECETDYEFYVRAVCGTDWNSENYQQVQVTTSDCSESCNAPTGLTNTVSANSVAVSWTPSEGNTSFEVEYGIHGFTHGSGTVVSASEPSATINGLDYNTQYDLYVRALCGTDNYSPWSNVSTFTTQPLGINPADTPVCTIFPNPTSYATTINVSGINGQVKIEVIDMNGHTVTSETLECASDCTKTLHVDHLAQGAYFVRITGQQFNMVKKLIVK